MHQDISFWLFMLSPVSHQIRMTTRRHTDMPQAQKSDTPVQGDSHEVVTGARQLERSSHSRDLFRQAGSWAVDTISPARPTGSLQGTDLQTGLSTGRSPTPQVSSEADPAGRTFTVSQPPGSYGDCFKIRNWVLSAVIFMWAIVMHWGGALTGMDYVHE